jgi:proteic killer suppression protein
VSGDALRMYHWTHALGGDRQDEWAIRINDQYRVCFVWRIDGPHEVEIVDYH